MFNPSYTTYSNTLSVMPFILLDRLDQPSPITFNLPHSSSCNVTTPLHSKSGLTLEVTGQCTQCARCTEPLATGWSFTPLILHSRNHSIKVYVNLHIHLGQILKLITTQYKPLCTYSCVHVTHLCRKESYTLFRLLSKDVFHLSTYEELIIIHWVTLGGKFTATLLSIHK